MTDTERRGYVEQAEIWQARATKAEARVAELEAEAKALAEDRGKLMRVLIAQTGETMRLRGAAETALELLRADCPKAASELIRKAVEPPHA